MLTIARDFTARWGKRKWKKKKKEKKRLFH